MKNGKRVSRLPVDVSEALQAIATTGKGRCWYCDRRLPDAGAAIAGGWDVQRMEEVPVASIILVCPACRHREPAEGEAGLARGRDFAAAMRVRASIRNRHGNRRRLALEPKRA